MMLIDDWKTVLAHAWSVRFSLLSALLTGIDFAWPYLLPEHPSRVCAVLGGCFAAAAAAARLILQFKLSVVKSG